MAATRFQRPAVLWTVALLCSAASAQPLDDAWKHYDQAHYGQAAEAFRALNPVPPQALGALCEMAVAHKAISTPEQDTRFCKDGVEARDPQALVAWGEAHLDGHERLGVARDPVMGLGYLARAATAQYPVASEALCGAYYQAGQFTNAAPFCKVAAAAHLPRGLLNLARMSLEGKGAVQDYGKARSFALLSAQLNYPEAYHLLGTMEESGTGGTPPNPIKAYAWYSLAAAAAPDWKPPRSAREQLKLDAAGIAAAQKAASTWKRAPDLPWRQLYPSAAKKS
jgi:TPR repeat protein